MQLHNDEQDLNYFIRKYVDFGTLDSIAYYASHSKAIDALHEQESNMQAGSLVELCKIENDGGEYTVITTCRGEEYL